MTTIRTTTGLGLAIVLLGLLGPSCASKKTTKIVPEKTTGVGEKDAGDKYILWWSVNQNRDTLEKVDDSSLPSRFEILVNGKRVFERGLGGTHIGNMEKDVTEFIADPDEVSVTFRIYQRDKITNDSGLVWIYLPALRRETELGTEYLLKHNEVFGSGFIAADKKWLLNAKEIGLKLKDEKGCDVIVEHRSEGGSDFLRIGPRWVYESKESFEAKYLHGTMVNRLAFLIPNGSFAKGDYAQYTWTNKKPLDPSLGEFKAKLYPEPAVEIRRATVSFGEGKYSINPQKDKGLQSIKRIVSLFKKHNLNTIGLFGVTHGQAHYQSAIIPEKSPQDWDPLAELIKEAHKHGIKVRPYLCLMTQYNSSLLKKHPDWARVGQDGSRSKGWACHSSPGYRKWIAGVVKELVTNYDIDGLALDYNRTHLCYCDRCRKAYKKTHGVDPVKLGREDSAWCDWTRNQLTEIIKEVHDTIKEVKPALPLSVYSWMGAIKGSFADWPTWIEKGYIDELMASGYLYTTLGRADSNAFRLNCQKVLKIARQAEKKEGRKCPVYFIIGVDTSHGRLISARELAEYVDAGRREGASGFSFFKFMEMGPFLPELSKTVFTKKASPHPGKKASNE